jgi:uncharacterized protein (DUF2147 family)
MPSSAGWGLRKHLRVSHDDRRFAHRYDCIRRTRRPARFRIRGRSRRHLAHRGIGLQILVGLKPDGANKWSGQIYNPEDGKTYGASVSLANANTLKVQGCIVGGVICKTNTWTKN